MKTYTVAELLSTASVAKANAETHNNGTWAETWAEIIRQIEKEILPAGGGFDAGTSLVSATGSKLILSTSFHHMNDGGYYDGWTEHTVTVKARFGGFDLSISGRNRRAIKYYIGDCFHACLSTRVDYSVDSNGAPTVSRTDGEV